MTDRLIYTFKLFLQERFPFPVRKLPVHTYLGCPHRNNRTGGGGCIYCYNPSFSTLTEERLAVPAQLQEGIQKARARGFAGKFLAYFQTDTNTYAHWRKLKEWWETIFRFQEDVVGLAVSTRPDCLSAESLQVLNAIGERCLVWLELGLQSAHDRTLSLINRGHDYAAFVRAVDQVRAYPRILLGVHVILGLPGESETDMRHTVSELNRLKVDGVKFHHLQIVQNTPLADWYAQGRVQVFSAEEYVGLLVRLLPRLSPEMVVLRLVGDVYEPYLIAPRWPIPKTRIIQMVQDELRRQGLSQGCLVES